MALSECAKYNQRKIYGVIRNGRVVVNQLSFEECIDYLDQHLEFGHGFIYDSLSLRIWYIERLNHGI